MQQFYIIWTLLGVIFVIVCMILAWKLWKTLQQIRITARNIDRTIRENRETFENLKKLSRQLNEQIEEIGPVVTQVKEMAAKINNIKQGFMNISGILLSLTGNRLGRWPAYIAGVSWILKKFRKGGKQPNV